MATWDDVIDVCKAGSSKTLEAITEDLSDVMASKLSPDFVLSTLLDAGVLTEQSAAGQLARRALASDDTRTVE